MRKAGIAPSRSAKVWNLKLGHGMNSGILAISGLRFAENIFGKSSMKLGLAKVVVRIENILYFNREHAQRE